MINDDNIITTVTDTLIIDIKDLSCAYAENDINKANVTFIFKSGKELTYTFGPNQAVTVIRKIINYKLQNEG